MFHRKVTARHAWALPVVVALALTLTACNPPRTDVEAAPDGQEELIAQAQAEGVVRLGTGGHTEDHAALAAEAFEEKYGIRVEYVREGSGQIVQKVEAQSSGGNVAFDVVGLLDQETMQRWADTDFIVDAEVPNVGDVVETFRDESAPYYPIYYSVVGFSYNEARNPEPPTTWEELAEADGTLGIGNPATSGTSLNFAAAMDEIYPEFYEVVGQSGNALIADSALGLGQLVITGEVDYAVPGSEQDVFVSAKAGEPIRMGYPEGNLTGSVSYVAALADAANPAAARLFVQFSLSEEFQRQQAETGTRSVLPGIESPEGLRAVDAEDLIIFDQSTLATLRDGLVAAFDAAMR
jgi:iron(III) transport system substrate-binding protein